MWKDRGEESKGGWERGATRDNGRDIGNVEGERGKVAFAVSVKHENKSNTLRRDCESQTIVSVSAWLPLHALTRV